MKKLNFKFAVSILSVFFFGIFILASCEGPEGPAGADGMDGKDANSSCLVCHNAAHQDTVEDQYLTSGHAAGAYVGYAGGRQSCATCHSHEGFVETMYTGMDTTAADIALPTPVACGTCHESHQTFDFESDGQDYALRVNNAFALITGHELDFDGTSNLCSRCHQARRVGPDPLESDSFAITSSHWGPHHGPQANVIMGVDGYEIAGSVAYPTDANPHMDAGCTSCHMHKDDMNIAEGGHTFWPSVASCTQCHTDATEFDMDGKQTEIEGLIDELEAKLLAVGILEIEDDEAHLVAGTYDVDHAGAYYNYALVGFEDKSLGIHNYAYAKALLQNSIEVFD